MNDVVLDSSAALAHLNGEPGGALVRGALKTSSIAAINYAETITKLIESGYPPDHAEYAAFLLGCRVVEANMDRAVLAGALHARVRRQGVSLADCFCLVLGQELGAPIMTSDRQWTELDLGVEITLIR